MEKLITAILIPIYIGIFVNFLTAREKTVRNNRIEIRAYKEIIMNHINCLKTAYGKKVEVEIRCKEIISMSQKAYQAYLFTRGWETRMTNELCEIQNDCIKAMDTSISLCAYDNEIMTIEKDVNLFFNQLIDGLSSKTTKSDVLNGQFIIQLLLANITLLIPTYIFCLYFGVLEDDFITDIAIIAVGVLYWILEITIISVVYSFCEKRHRRKHQ